MNDALRQESAKLAKSWMRHDQAMLRDYLVADVEDPRINVQSMLTRHFLASELLGVAVDELAHAELKFGATMNWLIPTARKVANSEILGDVDYALSRGADEAEGVDLPYFLRAIYASLPCKASGLAVPNYISQFLKQTRVANGEPIWPEPVLNTFQTLWRQTGEARRRLSVLEPACGSANDYRFLQSYGIARGLDYTGIDICEKNIANARQLFPSINFKAGNVFEIEAADGAFESAFTHDLFEHLSPAGIETAVAELCRVTRRSMCLHFFNMDESPEDKVQPVEDYHWNQLSALKMRDRFVARGFKMQIIHIGQFILNQTACDQTHNPGAYTFILSR